MPETRSDDGEVPLPVLIVDDEPLARNRLQAICKRTDTIGTVHQCDSGEEACEYLRQHLLDIVLLDVDMPGHSGLETAEAIRADPVLAERVPEIIFTTAHSSYAAQAYRLNVADYLLKPVKQAQLEEAISRARDRLLRRNQVDPNLPPPYLWVQDNAGSVQILCSDIAYILAERDYMRLCLSTGRSWLVHEPMHVLQDRLPSGQFLRIHRSTIVQRDMIREFRREGRNIMCILKDDTRLAVGPSYRKRIGQNIRGK